jgi:beta-glucosidase-like glycosyl hydrolase
MIQYYDYPLEAYLNVTLDLVANGTVALSTLQSHVRRVLGVKYDLGLFENPYISDEINTSAITESHIPLTLEAAHKSITLLENRNQILPLDLVQKIRKMALIGPFSDTSNYARSSIIVSS